VASFVGGQSQANLALRRFLRNRLRGYARNRNHPNIDGTSQLSPYLHFGHIGPHAVACAVGAAEAPDIDRWKTKGEAIFATGLTIDPDSEDTRIIYNNTPSGELFSSTLAPGNFVQNDPTKLKWKFKNKDANVPGSPSWRKGKFTIKSTKIKFTLDGRKTTLFTLAEAGTPPLMRQTVRVGDVCITQVIGCEVKGKTLKCPTP
jgi:hypothetical protein